MAKSEALHELIHQLEKSEKRMFRLFAHLYEKGEAEANYLQLFDIIAAQKTYDEDKVCKKLGDTTFARNLSNSKYQLYHLILKSLRHQHAHSRTHFRVREMWMDMYLLMEKGLFHQAEKVADKAMELAQKHALFAAYLDFSRVKRILVRRSNRRYKRELLHELAEAAGGELEKVKEQLDVLADFDKTFLMIQEMPDMDETEWDRIYETYQEKLYQIELDGEKLSELLYYYQPLITYYREKKKFIESLQLHDRMAALLNQSKTIRKEAPDKFIGFFLNYFNRCLPIKDLHKMERIIAQMKEVKPRSRKEAAHFSGYILYCEAVYYYMAGQYQEVEKLAASIDSPEIALNKALRWGIVLNIGTSLVLLRKYEEAAFWLNSILQSPEPELIHRGQLVARFLSVVCFDELKDVNLFTHHRRSLARFLQKQDPKLQAIFKAPILQFRKYLDAISPQLKCTALEAIIAHTEQDYTLSAITLWARQKWDQYNTQ